MLTNNKILGSSIYVNKSREIIVKTLQQYEMEKNDAIERANNILQFMTCSAYTDSEAQYHINQSLTPTESNKGLQEPDKRHASIIIVTSFILLSNKHNGVETFARIRGLGISSTLASFSLKFCKGILDSFCKEI